MTKASSPPPGRRTGQETLGGCPDSPAAFRGRGEGGNGVLMGFLRGMGSALRAVLRRGAKAYG